MGKHTSKKEVRCLNHLPFESSYNSEIDELKTVFLFQKGYFLKILRRFNFLFNKIKNPKNGYPRNYIWNGTKTTYNFEGYEYWLHF